jgi:Xaa-Pro aminopeptidase
MYPHQSERLTEVLERQGLRALVGSTAANVRYVTGFAGESRTFARTPRFGVFAPAGTALVVPAEDVPGAIADQVDATHVVAYGACGIAPGSQRGAAEERMRSILASAVSTPGDALAAALSALGAAGGPIGLDEGDLTPASWAALDRLGGATLVPAAGHFLTARRVKGPYELDCLQRALALAEESLNHVLQSLEPGVTEREALTTWRSEVIKRGGVPLPGVIACGPRSWIPFPEPTDRPLRQREIVRFDLSCMLKGYCGSVARTAVMGDPDDAQQKLHDALQAGVEAAIAAVAPGVTAAALHVATVDAVRQAGLAAFQAGRSGQAIGLDPWEDPVLEPGAATPLEMGEVLCVEADWGEIGGHGAALRETVLVTRLGGHPMNRSVRGLVVLD